MSTFAELAAAPPDGAMPLPAAAALARLRARSGTDPYNPGRTVEDWSDPERIEIRGFVSSSSSTETPDAAREEAVSTAVLTCAPGTDVRRGDRIEAVPPDGRTWRVTGFPARDASPFTGWAPTLEADLEEVVG